MSHRPVSVSNNRLTGTTCDGVTDNDKYHQSMLPYLIQLNYYFIAEITGELIIVNYNF